MQAGSKQVVHPDQNWIVAPIFVGGLPLALVRLSLVGVWVLVEDEDGVVRFELLWVVDGAEVWEVVERE